MRVGRMMEWLSVISGQFFLYIGVEGNQISVIGIYKNTHQAGNIFFRLMGSDYGK